MQDEIIRMAREAGLGSVSDHLGFVMFNTAGAKELQRFAALVAAHEREKFYGKDKPEECANGCPKNQVCDYCQRAEQAEQEPMYISKDCVERGCACHYSVEVDGEPVAVYSAPVRTKDLTDDEIVKVTGCEKDRPLWLTVSSIARAVIAADREKNK